MEPKMILNKTEKEAPATTLTTEKPTPSPERPLVRRRNRRRLPAW
jgi:hypothetical protein